MTILKLRSGSRARSQRSTKLRTTWSLRRFTTRTSCIRRSGTRQSSSKIPTKRVRLMSRVSLSFVATFPQSRGIS
ncbi:hypothetical protein ATCV1_z800L [Acanthocystis turfacea chlorella virus 1]|uniref:Uncharacterized protein z800L n=1 Tax=Chlorovirus heliozoae TaxID=322019 RepID=A7KA60_9PHYC|nr:hypothetical protein ATCV1_z800L [Acanthocystis turfacea chlorella virus 1]ABT16934.1 hypothetical protein ATCV1_z800L [Acanthocystis turfacea chlorella virus 1]